MRARHVLSIGNFLSFQALILSIIDIDRDGHTLDVARRHPAAPRAANPAVLNGR
jgi:hypothetical protein